MIQDLMRAVDRLTLVTKTMVSRSPLVVVDAPPLLRQLRAAVHPSGEPSAGGSGAVSGTPLDLSALELMTTIEDEVNRLYWLVRDATRRPGFGGYTLEQRLLFTAQRAMIIGRDDLIRDAPAWVQQIEALFDPPKVVPLPGHACPTCHTVRASVTLDTGEKGEAPALTVRFGDRVTASCAKCGDSWPVMDLARVLGGDTQVMAHVMSNEPMRRVS